jgi:hypothetical protein
VLIKAITTTTTATATATTAIVTYKLYSPSKRVF